MIWKPTFEEIKKRIWDRWTDPILYEYDKNSYCGWSESLKGLKLDPHLNTPDRWAVYPTMRVPGCDEGLVSSFEHAYEQTLHDMVLKIYINNSHPEKRRHYALLPVRVELHAGYVAGKSPWPYQVKEMQEFLIETFIQDLVQWPKAISENEMPIKPSFMYGFVGLNTGRSFLEHFILERDRGYEFPASYFGPGNPYINALLVVEGPADYDSWGKVDAVPWFKHFGCDISSECEVGSPLSNSAGSGRPYAFAVGPRAVGFTRLGDHLSLGKYRDCTTRFRYWPSVTHAHTISDLAFSRWDMRDALDYLSGVLIRNKIFLKQFLWFGYAFEISDHIKHIFPSSRAVEIAGMWSLDFCDRFYAFHEDSHFLLLNDFLPFAGRTGFQYCTSFKLKNRS